MGRATYEEILGFDIPWPYPEQRCVVFSSGQPETKSPNTAVISKIDRKVIRQLKEESEKDLWLVGGGKVISEFLKLRALDEMIITVIPRLLGHGIPLFPEGSYESELQLHHHRIVKNGVVILHYHLQR